MVVGQTSGAEARDGGAREHARRRTAHKRILARKRARCELRDLVCRAGLRIRAGDPFRSRSIEATVWLTPSPKLAFLPDRMHWNLLHSPPLPSVENMALDEALMERARRTGEAVFRIYTWAEATLSFGRNQTAAGVYDAGRAREHNVAVVRRLTGGRALLHHREVTYSVTAPLALGASLRESYARINRLLVDGLRRLGVAVEVALPRERSVSPGAAPCFERPAAGELVVDGRKLVGSAQWRDEGAMLQHGSILVQDDQPMVASLARDSVAPPVPAATLQAALGRLPDPSEVADAMFEAVLSLECADATVLAIDAQVEADMARAVHRYRNDQWTWRR